VPSLQAVVAISELGMPIMTTGEVLALIAVGTNLIAAIVGLTWGLSRVKDQLEEKLEEQLVRKIQVLIQSSISESELKQERVFGEVSSALREKIVQVEFFVRDNYVRQKDFETMVKLLEGRFDRLQDSLDKLGNKFDAR
jgi:hypothetical protein